MSKKSSLIIVLLCYLTAIGLGIVYLCYFTIDKSDLLIDLFIADLIATVIIYIFSLIFKNASLYDPYWSVIPPFLLIYWALQIPDLNYFNFY